MKKLILLLLPLFFICLKAQAGWNLTFCDRVDSIGKCDTIASEFVWNGDKTSVYATLQGDQGFTTGKVFFKVFDMKNPRSGELYAELRTYVRPEWSFTTKRIYFIKPGYYKIEVYDESYMRLAEGYITVTDREY